MLANVFLQVSASFHYSCKLVEPKSSYLKEEICKDSMRGKLRVEIVWFCYVAFCQNLPCLIVHFVKVAGFYLCGEQKAPAGRIEGSWSIIRQLIPLLKKCSLRRRISCAIFTAVRKYCATVKLTHILGLGYPLSFNISPLGHLSACPQRRPIHLLVSLLIIQVVTAGGVVAALFPTITPVCRWLWYWL